MNVLESLPSLLPGFLPSPTESVWHLGPVPIRAYALALIAGIVVAGWIGARRLAASGYKADSMFDIALWAVPFGIVGARIYHVITSPEAYFGPGGNPWAAFAIWQGGLGVWGSIALGAVGAAIGARRVGVPLSVAADALAPGIAVGQAIGRLGNWFNQELFGAPTTLPWGLKVSAETAAAAGFSPDTLFHPTFLYELLWNLGVAAVLVWAGRRWVWGHGQTFFAYMTLYCLGRVWIEALRIDTANHFLGLRLNVWTSIVVGLAGAVCFAWSRRKHGGTVQLGPLAAGVEPESAAEDAGPVAAGSAGSDDVDGSSEDAEVPADELDTGAAQPSEPEDAPADTDDAEEPSADDPASRD
ncbi:MAG: prolipoprotein diacylglyceryl transferase [Bifidobacteriaceae bacterium]|jgi:prolipoprotein diacylglyceryl transferase|nr:prolipoprotein diacylglyceryl transferase [Bifidobacteriaceae bacterium]